MSKGLHLGAGDSRLFPPFFVCLQDTYHPKMCGFLSVWRFLLSFVCPRTPAVYKMRGFLPSGACPPLSLLIPSYLPPVTHRHVDVQRAGLWQRLPATCQHPLSISPYSHRYDTLTAGLLDHISRPSLKFTMTVNM